MPNKNLTYPLHLAYQLPALSLALILTGCGGGGGGGSSSTLVKPDYIQPNEPIDLSVYNINPGSYTQQTIVNADEMWQEGYKGSGVSIGFVDSGVNPNHIDFYDDNGYTRIDWENARGIVSDDGYDITFTYDYVDIDSDIGSGGYHGTHITSIAAGREYGIAPEASIIPVNVFFDNASAFNTVIHKGVDYLAQKSPIVNASITQMVNLSVLGAENSEYNLYLQTLENNNSVLVTAAGNGGIDFVGDPIGAEHFINFNDARNLSIMSEIDNQVLHVIALETTPTVRNGNEYAITDFSNYPGSCSDVEDAGSSADVSCNTEVMTAIQNNFISAPGEFIEAAYGANNTDSISYSGTSMATPVVSGGLALLLSGWDQLTPQQAVAILKESANDSGIYADTSTYGVGLIDLEAALQPLGDLKSGASLAPSQPAESQTNNTQASFSINESSSTLPSELAGLAKLPALKSVAYFDKYNRNYDVDVTRLMEIDKQAIEWNSHWANQATTQQNFEFNQFNMQVSFNPSNPFGIEHINLSNKDSLLKYQAFSSGDFVNNTFINNHQFLTANNKQFGHSFTAAHQVFDSFSLLASFQDSAVSDTFLTPSLQEYNLLNDNSETQYSLGFKYELNPQWSLLAASQISQQAAGFNQAVGNGVFDFGKDSRTQQQLMSLSYQTDNSQLYGQFTYGQLQDITPVSGSYIDIEEAKYAQFKLGLIHQLNDNRAFGLETYNSNTLVDSTIKMTLPTGLDANGNMTSKVSRYQIKNDLTPDSLQLFYNAQLARQANLQLNYIATPDDRGVGLFIKKMF